MRRAGQIGYSHLPDPSSRSHRSVATDVLELVHAINRPRGFRLYPNDRRHTCGRVLENPELATLCRAILGSVTDKVVRGSHVPLLIYRPPISETTSSEL